MTSIVVEPDDIFASHCTNPPFKQRLNDFAMQSTGRRCHIHSGRFPSGKSGLQYAAIAAVHPFVLTDNPNADSPPEKPVSVHIEAVCLGSSEEDAERNAAEHAMRKLRNETGEHPQPLVDQGGHREPIVGQHVVWARFLETGAEHERWYRLDLTRALPVRGKGPAKPQNPNKLINEISQLLWKPPASRDDPLRARQLEHQREQSLRTQPLQEFQKDLYRLLFAETEGEPMYQPFLAVSFYFPASSNAEPQLPCLCAIASQEQKLVLDLQQLGHSICRDTKFGLANGPVSDTHANLTALAIVQKVFVDNQKISIVMWDEADLKRVKQAVHHVDPRAPQQWNASYNSLKDLAMGTPLSLGINPDIDQGLPQLEAICLQSTSLNQTKPRSKLTWSRDRDDGSMNKSAKKFAALETHLLLRVYQRLDKFAKHLVARTARHVPEPDPQFDGVHYLPGKLASRVAEQKFDSDFDPPHAPLQDADGSQVSESNADALAGRSGATPVAHKSNKRGRPQHCRSKGDPVPSDTWDGPGATVQDQEEVSPAQPSKYKFVRYPDVKGYKENAIDAAPKKESAPARRRRLAAEREVEYKRKAKEKKKLKAMGHKSDPLATARAKDLVVKLDENGQLIAGMPQRAKKNGKARKRDQEPDAEEKPYVPNWGGMTANEKKWNQEGYKGPPAWRAKADQERREAEKKREEDRAAAEKAAVQRSDCVAGTSRQCEAGPSHRPIDKATDSRDRAGTQHVDEDELRREEKRREKRRREKEEQDMENASRRASRRAMGSKEGRSRPQYEAQYSDGEVDGHATDPRWGSTHRARERGEPYRDRDDSPRRYGDEQHDQGGRDHRSLHRARDEYKSDRVRQHSPHRRDSPHRERERSHSPRRQRSPRREDWPRRHDSPRRDVDPYGGERQVQVPQQGTQNDRRREDIAAPPVNTNATGTRDLQGPSGVTQNPLGTTAAQGTGFLPPAVPMQAQHQAAMPDQQQLGYSVQSAVQQPVGFGGLASQQYAPAPAPASFHAPAAPGHAQVPGMHAQVQPHMQRPVQHHTHSLMQPQVHAQMHTQMQQPVQPQVQHRVHQQQMHAQMQPQVHPMQSPAWGAPAPAQPTTSVAYSQRPAGMPSAIPSQAQASAPPAPTEFKMQPLRQPAIHHAPLVAHCRAAHAPPMQHQPVQGHQQSVASVSLPAPSPPPTFRDSLVNMSSQENSSAHTQAQGARGAARDGAPGSGQQKYADVQASAPSLPPGLGGAPSSENVQGRSGARMPTQAPVGGGQGVASVRQGEENAGTSGGARAHGASIAQQFMKGVNSVRGLFRLG